MVPIARDLAAVQAQVDGMARLVRGQHRYLNDRRGIPAETIAHPRFCERVRVDDRGNAAFIHINRDGVSGFELKNYKFTGFSKAGAKGLFASACYPDDHCLVFGEAAIDVLSYATLEGLDRTRFVSLSGQPSPAQLELARAAMLKQPSGEVVLAFDNDEGGDKLGDRFTEMFGGVGRDDLSLRLHRPETRGFDWNEELNTAEPEQEPPPPPSGLCAAVSAPAAMGLCGQASCRTCSTGDLGGGVSTRSGRWSEPMGIAHSEGALRSRKALNPCIRSGSVIRCSRGERVHTCK